MGQVAVVTIVLVAAILLLVQSGIPWIRSEEVVVESGEVRLAATLSLPRWKKGLLPAVVVVHGSGPVRRRQMRGYLRKLIPQGVAVLLYDKRGVGSSTGSYAGIGVADSEQRLAELADDAAAVARWLTTHPRIDPSRVGLLGGSQAGWIMPLAASRTEAVRFLVGISAPGVTVGQEIYYSRLTGDNPEGQTGVLTEEEIYRRLAGFEGPHGYDPAEALDALAVPSLWILGGKDRSVPTEWTVRNLQRIQAKGLGLLDLQVFPEGDHGIRETDTGKKIEFWPRIYSWMQERRIIEAPEREP